MNSISKRFPVVLELPDVKGTINKCAFYIYKPA